MSPEGTASWWVRISSSLSRSGRRGGSARSAASAATPGHLPVPATTQAARPSLEVGSRVGQYLIRREIGRGGMGIVFEATHEEVRRRVAIKILHARCSREPETVARFLNEARAANTVQHPSIVNMFEIGQLPDGAAYTVMEYLEGESLRSRFDRVGRRMGEATLRLCQQIAAALAVAYDRGVIHRDLKPDNVMIVPDPLVPGGERVKVLDFGLAKLIEPEAANLPIRTRTGSFMGTPVYMSPEQCREASKVDEKTDVYSLGVMLFQLLASRPPFIADQAGELIAMHLRDTPPQLQELAPGLPADLCQMVQAMLAKDPRERPTMQEVAEGLGRLQGTPLLPLGPPRSRRMLRIAVPLLAIMVALAAIGYRQRHRQPLRGGTAAVVRPAPPPSLGPPPIATPAAVAIPATAPSVKTRQQGKSIQRAPRRSMARPQTLSQGMPAPDLGTPAEPDITNDEVRLVR